MLIHLHKTLMSYRTFQDPTGTKWQVWSASPESGERRKAARRLAVIAFRGIDRRSLPDRRVKAMRTRSPVPKGFELGWLCFEADNGEKRRLAPVPPNWDAGNDSDLWKLAQTAKLVSRVPV